MNEAGILGPLVEIGTGRPGNDRRTEAGGDAGSARHARRIAEEADQAVVELVQTAAAGQRQLVGDVVAQLAERGIVAVDAELLGQPDVAGRAGHLQIVGQIVDDIILFDIMALALPEHAADKADRCVGGRCDACLDKALLITVDAVDILVGADQIVRIVAQIIARTIERVIEIGIIRIVARYIGAAAQVTAGDGQIPIAELALDRQGRLQPFVLAPFGIVLDGL